MQGSEMDAFVTRHIMYGGGGDTRDLARTTFGNNGISGNFPFWATEAPPLAIRPGTYARVKQPNKSSTFHA